MSTNIRRNRKILVAVDASDNAKRAVTYVRDLLEGLSGFHITLLTIIPKPSEDYFAGEAEEVKWIKDQKLAATSTLEDCRQMFIDAGFKEEDITMHLELRECSSIAECLLDEQRELSCGTVVIGRRGISRKEEFIFGSTSNKILHTPKDCSVWVVE